MEGIAPGAGVRSETAAASGSRGPGGIHTAAAKTDRSRTRIAGQGGGAAAAQPRRRRPRRIGRGGRWPGRWSVRRVGAKGGDPVRAGGWRAGEPLSAGGALVADPVLELRVAHVEALGEFRNLAGQPEVGGFGIDLDLDPRGVEPDPARVGDQAVAVLTEGTPQLDQRLPQTGRALLGPAVAPELVLQPGPAALPARRRAEQREQALRFRGPGRQIRAVPADDPQGPQEAEPDFRTFGHEAPCAAK